MDNGQNKTDTNENETYFECVENEYKVEINLISNNAKEKTQTECNNKDLVINPLNKIHKDCIKIKAEDGDIPEETPRSTDYSEYKKILHNNLNNNLDNKENESTQSSRLNCEIKTKEINFIKTHDIPDKSRKNCKYCTNTFKEEDELHHHVALQHQAYVYIEKVDYGKHSRKTKVKLEITEENKPENECQYSGKNSDDDIKIDISDSRLELGEFNISDLKLEEENHNELGPTEQSNSKDKKFEVSTLQEISSKHNVKRTKSLRKKKYQCYKCPFQTNWSKELDNHFWTHKDKKTGKLQCELCPKLFFRKRRYDYHIIKTHKYENSHLKKFITNEFPKCSVCGHEASNESSLKQHIANVHSNKEKLYCYNCDFNTIGKSYLIQHIRSQCQPVYKYFKLPCKFCPNLIFKTKGVLYNHYLRDHSEEPDVEKLIKRPIYSCEECPYKNVDKKTVTRHAKSHERAKSRALEANIADKIMCQYCDTKLMVPKSHMDYHILRVHGKEVNSQKVQENKSHSNEQLNTNLQKNEHEILFCDNCDFKSTSKSFLLQHIRTKCKNFNLPCTFCSNLVFKSDTGLYNHYLRDHAEEPDLEKLIKRTIYHCDQCPYKTVVANNLVNHQKTHGIVSNSKVDKNFTCPFCDKTLKRKKNLENHILTLHEGKVNVDALISSPVYNCTECSYKTVDKYRLEHHSETHIANREVHQCPKCKFKTDRKRFFKLHVSLGNCIEKLKKFECKFCPGLFYQRKKALDMHYISVHKNTVPNIKELITSKLHSCNICLFETTQLHALNVHMKRHEKAMKSLTEIPRKKGKYPCQLCNCAYEKPNELDRHILARHRYEIDNIQDVVNREVFTCHLCRFKTVIKSKLVQHERRHAKKKRLPKILYCFKCTFKTDRKLILIRHIKADCQWGWGV